MPRLQLPELHRHDLYDLAEQRGHLTPEQAFTYFLTDPEPIRCNGDWVHVCCVCLRVYTSRIRRTKRPDGLTHCPEHRSRRFPSDGVELLFECVNCGREFPRFIPFDAAGELAYAGGEFPRYCGRPMCERAARARARTDRRRAERSDPVLEGRERDQSDHDQHDRT